MFSCDKSKKIIINKQQLLGFYLSLPHNHHTMKITDLELPVKVKLNSNFNLDESFDIGTILLLKSIEKRESDVYKVHVSALVEDIDHNISVCGHDWFNHNTKEFDLTIYEANEEQFDKFGNFNDVLWIMEDSECFDIYDDSSKKLFTLEDMINVIGHLTDKPTDHLTKEIVLKFVEDLKN